MRAFYENLTSHGYWEYFCQVILLNKLLSMEKLHKPACYSYIFKEAHMSFCIFPCMNFNYCIFYQLPKHISHMFILCEGAELIGWKDESLHTVQYSINTFITPSNNVSIHKRVFVRSNRTRWGPDEIPVCLQTLFNGLMKVLEEHNTVCGLSSFHLNFNTFPHLPLQVAVTFR